MTKKEDKIIIYSSPDRGVVIEAKLENDSIWLNQNQIAEIFGVNRQAITRHLLNIFRTDELKEKSVCSILEHTGSDGKTYQTKFYSLDAIISVGYRVNSKKATQFRVWATTTLRKYLIDGYAINQKRLAEQEKKLTEIQKTVALIRAKSDERELIGYEHELLELINEYTKSLVLLNKFDENTLKIGRVNRYIKYRLDEDEYAEAKKEIVELVAKEQKVGDLFGQEIGNKIKGIVGSINQTYDGKELYGSIEEKAAHLLYFVIKDHPYNDGNKRIGSMLFLYFLQRNGHLFRENGEAKINDNAMVALALLIAVSSPAEKDNLIKLIVNLIKE